MSQVYRVYIGKEQGLYINDEYILIKENGWNDFGFKSSAFISFHSNSVNKFKLRCNFAVRDLKNSDFVGFESGFINHLGITFSGNDHFSMLSSMEDYRLLFSLVSKSVALDILSSINDLVYIKFMEPSLGLEKRNLLYSAIDSDIFNKSFMRHSNTYFSFMHADDILRGSSYEKLNYISTNLEMRFHLDGFDNEHFINLKYNTSGLIPKRINVLIGENGVGKSSAINKFILSVLDAGDKNNFLIDKDTLNGRPIINNLVVFSLPYDSSDTFPNIREGSYDNYKKVSFSVNRGRWNGRLGSLLVALVRSETLIAGNSRFSIFIDAISKAIPLTDLFVELYGKYVRVEELQSRRSELSQLDILNSLRSVNEPLVYSNGSYHNLSSGQFSFFKLALTACLYIDNGCFLLIDEPESNLHPDFISKFIGIVDDLLEKTGSLALIATHSPYIVREITREQVHVLIRKEKNFIYITNPRLKTFGANISDISEFVFGDNIQNKLCNKIISTALILGCSFEDVRKEYSSELSIEMLHHIKERMDGGF